MSYKSPLARLTARSKFIKKPQQQVRKEQIEKIFSELFSDINEKFDRHYNRILKLFE